MQYMLSESAPQLIAIDDIRRITVSYKDILKLLQQLTSAPMIQKQEYLDIISQLGQNHFIFVLTIDEKPIGMITLLIEQKIIHSSKANSSPLRWRSMAPSSSRTPFGTSHVGRPTRGSKA